jgi:hypothetical protein
VEETSRSKGPPPEFNDNAIIQGRASSLDIDDAAAEKATTKPPAKKAKKKAANDAGSV